MNKYLLAFCTILFLFACKDKKKSLQDGEIVTAADFIDFFPEKTLPFQVADSALDNKPNDSLLIGTKTAEQFIPDSIFANDFGKTANPKLYALGKAVEKKKEKYLFIAAIAGSKRVAYLACFNNEDKFLRAMPLVRVGFEKYSSAYGMLDPKLQITTYRENKKSGEEVQYKRNVYFYDRSADNFTLIVTEPNEDIIQDVINPIDTFTTKHKFAGDYALNARNFISFRDSKDPSEVNFFVHFEKDGGACNGELKGVARVVSPTVVQYNKGDNPCVLEFTFNSSGSKVTMKEKGGCGTFRDIKCFFEGSFPKKKKDAAANKK
jgi:hypothetical protein